MGYGELKGEVARLERIIFSTSTRQKEKFGSFKQHEFVMGTGSKASLGSDLPFSVHTMAGGALLLQCGSFRQQRIRNWNFLAAGKRGGGKFQ